MICSPAHVADDLSLGVATDSAVDLRLAPQESHYVATGEVVQTVAQQVRIEVGQVLWQAEHHVRGPFALLQGPEVLYRLAAVDELPLGGMDPLEPLVEPLLPAGLELGVGELG